VKKISADIGPWIKGLKWKALLFSVCIGDNVNNQKINSIFSAVFKK
jgi:hypothetical protein